MKIFEAWKMLGIEATDDLAQIREVYLRLLPEYHPEDDPDGFMRLRLAYETVCADAKKADGAGAGTDGSQAAQTGGQSEESSERAAAIERMLSDFPRRMNDGEWEKLFDEVSEQGFDCQEAFSDELLTALMEGYYLPRRIWLLFDKTFSWSARANVLKEKYPSGYIEYVLNGMRYERSLRDVFFDYEKDAGADFDAFVGDFHALLDAVHSEDFEKAAELAAENKGSLFEHPDYQLMLARLYDLREDADAANAILTGLDERWPNDPFIRTAVANMLLQSGKAGEALDIYLEVLESNPEHRSAKIGAAHARIEEGLFEEAKADAYDLLMKDPFDGSAMGVFGKANEELIPIFRERLEKDADDMDARYKLSSCLFNMGDYTKSLDLIADTTPDEAHTAKHYELYADLFVLVTGDELTDEDKAILLEYVEAWERAEKDHQRLRFLPDKYRRLCMDDTALEKSEALLAEFPGDPEICRVKAQIYKDRGDERNAFAAITAGLEKSPAHAGLLAIESLLYEKTGNLGAAVDSANMSLDGFPFTIEMWELLCRVYDHVSDYAELVDTVKRAESFGMSNDALKLMKAVALYETEDPDDEAMALFEYVLEKDADNLVCLEKLGILYARSGRPDDAAALIARFIDLSEGPYGYLLRGWFYANFAQAGDGFAKARARADFRKAIEIDDRYALAWYQLGVLAYDEGCMAEAAANFQKTLELDPEFSNVHFYLSIACERTGDFNNAARALDEGMAVFEESDKDAYEMLYLKKADLLYERHLYHEYVPLGETAAKLEQDSVNAVQRRIQLARAYFETGDDEKAEALFRRLFDDCKSLQGEERLFCMSELEYSYGYFLKTAKKDPLAALEHYKQAYEGNSSLSMLVHLAEVYRVLGQIREAKILFKKVLSRRKEAKGSMCGEYQIGRCYFGLGDLKRAKIYLHRALNRTPDYTICALPRCYDALFVLGLIALAEGDRAGARAYYEQSIDIAWDREYREAAPMFE